MIDFNTADRKITTFRSCLASCFNLCCAPALKCPGSISGLEPYFVSIDILIDGNSNAAAFRSTILKALLEFSNERPQPVIGQRGNSSFSSLQMRLNCSIHLAKLGHSILGTNSMGQPVEI